MHSEVAKVFDNLNKDIQWIKDRTIFLTAHGSTAYNLSTPESDIDFRGICVPPKSYFFSFCKNFEQLEKKGPDPDTTIFHIKKFFNLAANCNPNCLEILFTEPEHHYILTDIGKILLDNRDKFLSRYVKERYIGFAKSQAHRTSNHKKWIDDAPSAPATRQECGLPPELSIPKDQFLTVQSLLNKKLEEWNPDFEPFSEAQKIYLKGKISNILTEMNILSDDKWMLAARSLGYNENFIHLLQKEKAYQNKVANYKNYLEWQKNRNPKRAEIEKKCFYDAKHMAQLIRLLKLGKEILLTGQVKIKRTDDREELMSIKRGEWKYEDVIAYADKLQQEVEDSYFKSSLPPQPNMNELDQLCQQLIEKSF